MTNTLPGAHDDIVRPYMPLFYFCLWILSIVLFRLTSAYKFPSCDDEAYCTFILPIRRSLRSLFQVLSLRLSMARGRSHVLTKPNILSKGSVYFWVLDRFLQLSKFELGNF
jgi:hypothetical protein